MSSSSWGSGHLTAFPAWILLAWVERNPVGVGFHLSVGCGLIGLCPGLVWPYARPALCQFLLRQPADVSASFHPVPNHALFLAHAPSALADAVAVVTLDMVTAHASGLPTALTCIPFRRALAKARALRWGLTEDRVIVTGMPTRRCFLRALDLSKNGKLERRSGLAPDIPVVLVVGGGEGMGPLAQVVRAIWRCRPKTVIVVITGRNQELHAELSALDLPVPLRVEGFVSNMEVWMRAADVLVTKAGPNTLSEAFIAGCRWVLYAALPDRSRATWACDGEWRRRLGAAAPSGGARR